MAEFQRRPPGQDTTFLLRSSCRGVTATQSLTQEERLALREWTRFILGTSYRNHPELSQHILRQESAVKGDSAWFVQSEADAFITQASIAVTDRFKKAPHQCASLLRDEKLPGTHTTFGEAFGDQWNGWVTMFAHSFAAHKFVLLHLPPFLRSNKLTGQPPIPELRAQEIARRVADSILGHDTLDIGFGESELKPQLQKASKVKDIKFTCGSPVCFCGALDELYDRLDALNWPTLLRYVVEQMEFGKTFAEAVRLGIFKNLTWGQDYLEHMTNNAKDGWGRANTEHRDEFLNSPQLRRYHDTLTKLTASLSKGLIFSNDRWEFIDSSGNGRIIEKLADLQRALLELFEGPTASTLAQSHYPPTPRLRRD